MGLKENIEQELAGALRARQALPLSVFRMLSAAIHNREIEKRTKSGQAKEAILDDEEIVQVIRSELKKRKDAAVAYRQGRREEAARREEAEADILTSFLPQELSTEELERLVSEGIEALGVTSVKDFGKVMSWVMARVKGQAGGERVAELVKRRLGAV